MREGITRVVGCAYYLRVGVSMYFAEARLMRASCGCRE